MSNNVNRNYGVESLIHCSYLQYDKLVKEATEIRRAFPEALGRFNMTSIGIMAWQGNYIPLQQWDAIPDSKVPGSNMGPIWGR